MPSRGALGELEAISVKVKYRVGNIHRSTASILSLSYGFTLEANSQALDMRSPLTLSADNPSLSCFRVCVPIHTCRQ